MVAVRVTPPVVVVTVVVPRGVVLRCVLAFGVVVRGAVVLPGVSVPGVALCGASAPGVVAPRGEVAPGVAPGVSAPGALVLPGVLVPGASAPGAVVVGVVGALVPGAVGAVAPVAGVVTVLVMVVGGSASDPPASFTKEAASTPNASTITAASPISGPRQLGVEARRVRAAAPQCRHQSWLLPSGEPHNGHSSVARGGAPVCAGAGETAAALTPAWTSRRWARPGLDARSAWAARSPGSVGPLRAEVRRVAGV